MAFATISTANSTVVEKVSALKIRVIFSIKLSNFEFVSSTDGISTKLANYGIIRTALYRRESIHRVVNIRRYKSYKWNACDPSVPRFPRFCVFPFRHSKYMSIPFKLREIKWKSAAAN